MQSNGGVEIPAPFCQFRAVSSGAPPAVQHHVLEQAAVILQVARRGFLLKQQLLDAARRREAFGAAVNRALAASELHSRGFL